MSLDRCRSKNPPSNISASASCSKRGTTFAPCEKSCMNFSYSAGGKIIYPNLIDGASVFEKVLIYITLSGHRL